jgi:hypothetical protein
MTEPALMKLGMAPEPISTTYFINPFLQLYQRCRISNYCSYKLNIAWMALLIVVKLATSPEPMATVHSIEPSHQ